MSGLINTNTNVPQDGRRGPYHQGWNAIAEELKKRLLSIGITDKIHCYLKFIRAGYQTREWQVEFAEKVEEKASKKPFVNTMMLNRDGYPVTKVSKDDTRWFTRTSTVEIHVFYSFPNFDKWHENLDRIQAILTEGDRTLNETCLTYSLADEGTSDLADFASIDTHRTIIKFKIKEAGMVDP